MSIRTKLTLVIVSGLIAFYAIVGGMMSGWSFGRVIANPGPYPQLKIFEEVVRHIVNDYVEKPDLNKVRVGALRGLADGLDPYSAYLVPQQLKEYQANRGHYPDMTGLVLGSVQRYAYVISVLPNSPAAQAGLQARDFIEYIDGHATPDMDLIDAYAMLSGQAGTSVELTYLRRGSRVSEKVKLTRAQVSQPKPELQLMDQQIGYIKIPSLQGQAETVQTVIKDAIKRGAGKIILDLRGSAGEDLQTGITVANYFLKTGTIVKVIGRKEKLLNSYEAKPELAITDLPLVVITDATTAGAAEIVAAAILDNKRGDVVGERTFGVGTQQQIFPLDDGSAMLLTTSRYAAPSGRFFFPDGVLPSVEVKRQDLAAASIPDDADNEPSPSPATTPAGVPNKNSTPTPTPAPTSKPTEDTLLKKAIEVAKSKKKSA
ncbi:MAG: PDZ domain-containing protein [Blastocatellia bacterium]|nr:PDZ domain-containing protein [Blastocatellia bacterium]